jgi:hypothetical protein
MAASPKEYREFAQDCLRGAAETKSERHRQILLEMQRPGCKRHWRWNVVWG